MWLTLAWRKEGDGRCKSMHICTQGPISNSSKNLWDSLIKGPENLISGFRKSGIYPTDRQPILKRLPSRSLDSSISSHVGESFLEQIAKKREEVTKARKSQRKKLNVPPGKSISAAEINAAVTSESAPGATPEPQSSTSGIQQQVSLLRQQQ